MRNLSAMDDSSTILPVRRRSRSYSTVKSLSDTFTYTLVDSQGGPTRQPSALPSLDSVKLELHPRRR